MADVAGTAYVSVAGTQIALVGECSYQVSGKTRESLMGLDGFHGTKVKPKQGMIKFKGRNLSSISMNDVADWGSVQVVVELANGKTVTGSGMFATEPPIADAEEATWDIQLEGPSVVEA